mmetsp:Transcript_265/g.348  ORF Transcript_265/g.348 Transcript_265/m.348 type:complete len:610 (-) Transcript_265:335-2164(-)
MEKAGHILIDEGQTTIEEVEGCILALSFCRRMIVVQHYSQESISVLYLDDNWNENNCRQKGGEERERQKGGVQDRKTSSTSTPPLACRTLLDAILPSACRCACFSPCHRLLAVLCSSGTLHVWYIRACREEVRWDKVYKKQVVVCSGDAASPPLSTSSVAGIPFITPLNTIDISRTYTGDWPTSSRCFFSSTGVALCVITPMHVYTFCVVTACRPYVVRGSYSTTLLQKGIQSKNKARSSVITLPYLSFCCHVEYGELRDNPFRCTLPGYHTAFKQDLHHGGIGPLWVYFDADIVKEEEMRFGVHRVPSATCLCKDCVLCYQTSSCGCGIRLKDNILMGESRAPAFFKMKSQDKRLGDVTRWSTSGELCAVGIAKRSTNEKHWKNFQGEGAIIILSRQGNTLLYKQCLALRCSEQEHHRSVTIRALEFSPDNDNVLLSLHQIEFKERRNEEPFCRNYLCVWSNGEQNRFGRHNVSFSKVQVIQYADNGMYEYPEYLFFSSSHSHLYVVEGGGKHLWKYKYSTGEVKGREEKKWKTQNQNASQYCATLFTSIGCPSSLLSNIFSHLPFPSLCVYHVCTSSAQADSSRKRKENEGEVIDTNGEKRRKEEAR